MGFNSGFKGLTRQAIRSGPAVRSDYVYNHSSAQQSLSTQIHWNIPCAVQSIVLNPTDYFITSCRSFDLATMQEAAACQNTGLRFPVTSNRQTTNLRRSQAGSSVHPASNSMDTGNSFLGLTAGGVSSRQLIFI